VVNDRGGLRLGDRTDGHASRRAAPRPRRLFVGIPLPDSIIDALQRVQQVFADTALRLEQPGKLHITLIFPGATSAHRIDDVVEAIGSAVAGYDPARLQLADVGAFPDDRRPNVAWVGVLGQTERLAKLHDTLSDALVTLGYAREARAFHPHITIGRTPRTATARQRRAIAETLARVRARADPPRDALEWTATRVLLYESVRGIYEPIVDFSLEREAKRG
jgi:2'-5' RNA ligase